MKKIGIMGGTFNPIHNAHLMMAEAAYEQYGLDEVWFMPSKIPPHKDSREIVSEEHRSRMIQFAIDDYKHFLLSDMELKREGVTYTCETLQQCLNEFPEDHFYFILGGDSLCDFEKWCHPEKIARMCTILSVSRGSMGQEELAQRCKNLSDQYDAEVFPVRMPTIDISSEMIRNRLTRGESIAGYLPETVLHYIELHSLYGTCIKKDTGKEKELLACLQATLRPQRYMHTLGVAVTAANLAACHMTDQEDEKRARRAGLLHDCAKYLTPSEGIALCQKYEIHLSKVEKENPALIHGKLGAYLAKKRYGVKDKEVCSAIECHTTGKPHMTTLEKIIYVADYIEPRRKMDCIPYSLAQIRRECFRDLDKGLMMILTNTVQYLQKSNELIDEMTLQTYQYYKDRKE